MTLIGVGWLLPPWGRRKGGETVRTQNVKAVGEFFVEKPSVMEDTEVVLSPISV
jgi:hypothetical protein